MVSSDLRRQREDQIARGALAHFKAKGYHATSIREIAASSGLSMGGLYEYISTKQDVLSLVYRHLITEVGSSTHIESVPVEEMLVTLMLGTAEHADEVQLVYRETASLDPEHRAQLADSELQQVAAIQAALEGSVLAGESSAEDPELAAHLIVFVTAFFPLRRWLLRHRADLGPEDVARAVGSMLMNGIRPR